MLLEQFVEVDQVEPVMLSGRTLYLFPDGLASQRPYLLLVEAIMDRRSGLRQKHPWALRKPEMHSNPNPTAQAVSYRARDRSYRSRK